MIPDSPLPSESSADPHPLSPEQLEALGAASERARKIRAAARAAAFTGWTTLVLGVLSLVLSLFSFMGLLVGGALVLVAWNELEGRKQVLRFDIHGPRRLARNQLWILAVIVTYCAWAAFRAHFRPNPDMSQVESLLGLEPGMVAEATVAVYGVVVAVAAAFQWAMYRYHAARVRLMWQYLAETPAWVLEIQRVVGGAKPDGSR